MRIGLPESLPRRLLAHSEHAANLLPSDPVFACCRDEGANPSVDSVGLASESLTLLEGFVKPREDVVLLRQDVKLLVKIGHELSVLQSSSMPDVVSCLLDNCGSSDFSRPGDRLSLACS